jgi:hypothetical protein
VKIVVADQRGEGLSLALRMVGHGHEVYHTSLTPVRAGTGLVVKAASLLPLTPRSLGVDGFFLLGQGYGHVGAQLRRDGRLVSGGSPSLDRLTRQEAGSFEACGVTVAPPGFKGCIEVYAETWYDQGRAIFTVTCLENRRFMDGDLGPEVDVQTSVCWINPMREPRVYQVALKKLEALFAAEKYTGPAGARLLISQDRGRPYLAKVTLGSPRHLNAYYCVAGFVGEQLHPESWHPVSIKQDFAYTIAVSIPPYPHFKNLGAQPVSCWGDLIGHDVELDSDNSWKNAGDSGLLGDVVGLGESVELARREAVKKMDSLEITDKQARRGGGATRMSRDIELLEALRYETPRRLRVEA